jgi:mevalonate kinase
VVKFKTSLPGKWVLVGEHTVTRGGVAIVFPFPEVSLCLDFIPQRSKRLKVSPPVAEPMIHELLGIYDSKHGRKSSFSWPTGRLTIQSDIPQGAGLGSSAALCSGLARWIASGAGIPANEVAETARSLETRFHGDSSGMDIAAVLANAPIVFEKGCPPRILKLERIPCFTLHDTGLRANTSECIARIKTFMSRNSERALSIDRAMNVASYKALKGLLTYGSGDERSGLAAIAEGMRMALDCFSASAWNLITETEERLIRSLLADGALAAKPTGSGGGMILALWGVGRSKGSDSQDGSFLRRIDLPRAISPVRALRWCFQNPRNWSIQASISSSGFESTE